MSITEDKKLENKIVGRELKAVIKFIIYIQKKKVDPNRSKVKQVIRGSLKSCYLQGKVDEHEKIRKGK